MVNYQLIHHNCYILVINSIKNVWPLLKILNIKHGMIYVDLSKLMTQNHISSNFSFNTGISWRFSIPGTQGCGRISWLLSEILFCWPQMNKKKSDLWLRNIGIFQPSFLLFRLSSYSTIWFSDLFNIFPLPPS